MAESRCHDAAVFCSASPHAALSLALSPAVGSQARGSQARVCLDSDHRVVEQYPQLKTGGGVAVYAAAQCAPTVGGSEAKLMQM